MSSPPPTDEGTTPRLRTVPVLLTVVGMAVVATVVGIVLLWPSGRGLGMTRLTGPPVPLVRAEVKGVETKRCPGPERVDTVFCVTATVLLTGGAHKGQEMVVDIGSGRRPPSVEPGDRLVLGYVENAPPGTQYFFADFERRSPMLWLVGLFVVAVVALARVRGARALLGLGVSLLVLVGFVIPSLLDGHNSVAVALVGSAAILLVNVYLAHGLNLTSTTAVVGTLASLAIIGLLAVIFVGATNLSGLASEEGTALQFASSTIDVQGLLLAGIIIGSLGVLDDVTVTQASAVSELHRANPALRSLELYRSALRVGRDHIASTVNTLILAYAGASLPLLILLVESTRRVSDVLNGEVVAIEIVRSLVGSIGLVASVPITTALAARVLGRGHRNPWRTRLMQSPTS